MLQKSIAQANKTRACKLLPPPTSALLSFLADPLTAPPLACALGGGLVLTPAVGLVLVGVWPLVGLVGVRLAGPPGQVVDGLTVDRWME